MSTPTAPLAALSTVFTPPCSTSWLLTTTKVPSQYPPFPTTGPSSCDPPSWATNIKDQGFEYYSPAICPSGFEVGPNCQVTKTRTAEGFAPISSGETAVYCVPSSFTCTTDTTDFRGGVWGFFRAAITATSGPVIVTVGPALQIRFKDADLSILETHPLTPGLVMAGVTTDTTSNEVSPISTTIAGFSTITRQATTTLADETRSSETSTAETFQDGTVSVAEPGTLVISTLVTTTATPSSSASQSSINPGSLAAIILSSILAMTVMAIGAVVIVRRNRRSQKDRSARLLRLRRVPWQPRGGDSGAGSRASVASVASIVLPMQAAELPGSAPIIPELALSTPFGAKENPAELGGRGRAAELTAGPVASTTTWSWMSRASGKWSARSFKTRSSVGRSSFRWTRSAASMQTTSTGRYSGDWESFARGKWGDANGLSMPAVPMDRPLPDIPKTPGSAKPHIASYLRPEIDLNRLSRISDGTFGAPGKSPVSTRFNRP